MLLQIIIIGIVGYITCALFFKNSTREKIEDEIDVPVVPGKLPLVGHALAFKKDILGFVRKASQNYGKIFKIQIVNKEMIVICDRKLISEFFKSTEEKLSLYEILEGLFFDSAFADDPSSMRTIIGIIKETIALRYDEFAPKIIDQAEKMIARINSNNESKLDLTQQMIRFVAATSAKCFMGYDIDDNFFEALMKFTELLNKIIVLTYFMPKWMIKLIYGRQLKSYRMIMSKILEPEINKYRYDLNKNDSLIFRKAVDFCDKTTHKKLNNEEIGGIITCLLYISSENTSLGASAALVDLALNPEWWTKVKNETDKYLQNNDINGLFKSEIINSCVLESGRLNVHIFPLNRRPKNKIYLDKYYIGDADVVGICEPLLMSDIYADDVYKNPKQYNPGRFIGPNAEPKDSSKLLVWGHGIHLCPGKMFAIYEITAALAMVVANFERFDLKRETMPELDYFSPSAYSERHVNVNFNKLNNIVQRQLNINNNVLMPLKPLKIINNVHVYENGWLIKNFITENMQIKMFEYTMNLSKNSKEISEITNIPKKTAYPIAFYNLVYTGTSNCVKPESWISLADESWNYLRKLDLIESKPEFNSVYAQLFDIESVMADHYDQGVDWGVSFSLGASCDFRFGEGKIVLDSGDVFISDFSKTLHGISKIHINSPAWIHNSLLKYDIDRVRMSVQVRYVKAINNMTETDFKSMLCNY